jgi:rare lipoprotein A
MTGLSKCLLLAVCAGLLAACSHSPSKSGSGSSAAGGGHYYKDDGPGDNVPANLDSIPDATPKRETLNRFANRPYTVLGKDYVPATELKPYREQGIASWYGRKFHNQKTAIGETYDMYAMTAAHPTLPLPSYARVTSVATGKSVIVRVNDRGPFLYGRVIDLSYAAAQRIGVAQKGSGEVVVEAIIPGDTVIATPLPPVSATPSEPMVQPAPATAASPSGGGFVVQLGAFRDNANAQRFLADAKERLASAAVSLQVRQSGGLWRVYAGPYPDRDSARKVGDQLYASFGVDTAVAPD